MTEDLRLIADGGSYTEVDPNTHLNAASAATLTITGISNNETAYSYKSVSLAGDFEIKGTINISAMVGSSVKYFYTGVSSDLGDGLATTHEVALRIGAAGSSTTVPTFFSALRESGSVVTSSVSSGVSLSTDYYYSLFRTSACGATDVLFYKIFTDSGRTTSAVTVDAGSDNPITTRRTYNYYYPAQSANSGVASRTVTATNTDVTITEIAAGIDISAIGTDTYVTSAVANAITVAALPKNVNQWNEIDYGASAFAGNYTLRATLNVTALTSAQAGTRCCTLALTNVLSAINALDDQHGIAITYVGANSFTLKARECSGGSEVLSSASSTISIYSPTFVEIERDTGVGTYGTLYLRLFSDPAFVYQIGSDLTITLRDNGTPDVVAFRYLLLVQSNNTGSTSSISFTVGGVEVTGAAQPVTGTIAFTQDNNTVAVTGTIKSVATIAFTQEDNTVAVTGTTPNLFNVGFTQADNVVAITGVQATQANISFTQDNNTVAISGTLANPIFTVAFTQADNVVAITADLINQAAISFTQDDNTVAIAATRTTTVAISFTQADNTVAVTGSVSAASEPFRVIVRHKSTNALITGLTTVMLKITNADTDFVWSFASNIWQASPTPESQAMTEVAAQPGRYVLDVGTSSWSGWIDFEATYDDGVYVYSWQGSAYYANGIRTNGAWNAVETASIAAIQSDTNDMQTSLTTLQASATAIEGYTDTLEASMTRINQVVTNKHVLNPVDGTIKVYNDAGTLILSGLAYSDAAGTVLYDGTAAVHHTTRLA